MPRSTSKRRLLSGGRLKQADPRAYWSASKRPLQILLFLFPLVLAYELALIFLLRDADNVRTVLAHKFLLQFFDAFQVAPEAALHLGGVAIIAVLLAWHALARDPWRASIQAAGLMALEALVLTMPLLVLSRLVMQARLGAPLTPPLNPPAGPQFDFWSGKAIAVGAGLYEELLFRMLLVAVVHTLLVDLGKASHGLGAAIAVFVSAAAFTWYHPLHDFTDVSFYFLAGLYLGAVYVFRGFGIVVAVHALYDLFSITPNSGA